MGQVVPFIARVRDSGDWSASERMRLEALADQLAAAGVRVEVIFGATDDGDPWCVVTDESGDVLIHVARIDGRFIVHSAVDDAVGESVDLHTALRDRIAATEEAVAPQSATILPFSLSLRQGQTFLALLAATAFFYETAGLGETAQAAEALDLSPTPEPTGPADDDSTVQTRETAAQAAAPQPATPHATPLASNAAPSMGAVVSAPAVQGGAPTQTSENAPPAAAPTADLASPTGEEIAVTIVGTDGDDRIEGTAANERILGGAGADTLSGGGGTDTLDGGAGDDRIEIAAGVTAIGGAGADAFVIKAPLVLGRADLLLGRIADFDAAEGDRIFSFTGGAIKIPPRPPTDTTNGADKGLGPATDGSREGGDPTGSELTGTVAPSDTSGGTSLVPGGGGDFGVALTPPDWRRVDVDLDGDGAFDGYILIRARPMTGDEAPIGVVGQGLTTPDPLG